MRRPFCAVLLALVLVAQTAGAQQGGADKKGPQPAQIDRNGVLTLVRSTILALHHANITGNYTVLRDLGAPGFQSANTAARLAEVFADLRGRNFDLLRRQRAGAATDIAAADRDQRHDAHGGRFPLGAVAILATPRGNFAPARPSRKCRGLSDKATCSRTLRLESGEFRILIVLTKYRRWPHVHTP